jgi:hypothetical protein
MVHLLVVFLSAANITNSAKNDFVIDFADQAVITWVGSFTEGASNTGTVTGSRVGTLSGDTFIAAITNGTAFTLTTHYTIANVPAGLTAVVTKTSPTVATITLTGSATTHANINDVTNLTITFADGVFTNTAVATNVTGSTNATGGIDFNDQPTILYAGNFTENGLNDGSVTGSRTATLTGDTYALTLTEGVHYTLTNKPAGLTAVMTRTSATVATLTFTGNAAAHANVNDVANLTITWLDGAFTTTNPASSVSGYTENTGTIDFTNPGAGTITYSASTFTESATNNSTISNILTLTLAGDTYVGVLTLGGNVTVTNVPAGLTAVVTRVSGSVATVALTGTATSSLNTNDIANLTVTFTDAAFTSLTASQITNSTKSDISVDFTEAALAYGTATFIEVTANDGTTATTSAVTLTGDTFTIQTNGAQFTQGVHYTVANLPAGMTLVITANDATTATVSITGNATVHNSAADIANLTITWLDAAFTNVDANTVTNYTKNNFTVDFTDQASILYAGNFTETGANGGALGGSRTATLTGDTYAPTLTEGVHYTLTNAPAGLTAVMTRTSATVATLTFTSSATTHTNAQDIANLTITWLDGAFTNTTLATNVTNYTNATGTIDFIDVSLAYSASTFTEAIALNGSIGNTVTVTLTGDTFTAGPFTDGVEYTTANTPVGLTAVVTRTSATTATISFTGTAGVHTNAQDIANFTVVFNDAAFTGAPAANITNSTKNNFVVDFGDATIAYTGAGFTESAANDGSVTGSIVATLTGDTWNAGLSATDLTLSNAPSRTYCSAHSYISNRCNTYLYRHSDNTYQCSRCSRYYFHFCQLSILYRHSSCYFRCDRSSKFCTRY